MKNKVFFGFSMLHIAFMKETSAQGSPEYEAPIHIPGAVTWSPSASASEYKFRADNIDYYVTKQNTGYSGDLEMAKWPDEIVAEMLGWVIDVNGALVEVLNGSQRPFAILAQIDGDQMGRRVVFYNCIGGTPVDDYATTGDTPEVKTQKMSITVSPFDLGVDMGNGRKLVTKAVLEYDQADHAAYDLFFDEVYIPETV